MSLTFTDLFCGAGGSSTGLVTAGFELKLAANHWARAIETHAANHRDADHWCEDINKVDMRRLPRTDVLWASPICTEISPAGGRARSRGQLSLMEEGHVPTEAFERTRATAYDVLRAAEVHRYKLVMCENVVEFATQWELFDWWREGMHKLGYMSQVISASSAHLGGDDNLAAPQWRDRIYVVFARNGINMPRITPDPLAWCPSCSKDVRAVQAWRGASRIGKYRQQYDYRCPESACRHTIVEPYVRPAAAIIDWTNLGNRIGDRAKPLAAATMARIRAGLAAYPRDTSLVTVNHSGHDGRAQRADEAPLSTRSTKIGDGIVTPLVIEHRRNGTATPADDAPVTTVTAGGNHHSLVIPDGAFLVRNYGGNYTAEQNVRPLTEPYPVVTTRDHSALVIPYRKGHARPASEPIITLATRDSAGLAIGGPDVEDCLFRMFQPREQLSAQRFPLDYIVHGNKGEQTMQAGNSVSVNAAQWIGRRALAALDGAA